MEVKARGIARLNYPGSRLDTAEGWNMEEAIVRRSSVRTAIKIAVILTRVMFQHQIFAAPPSGGATVRALYDALLSTMKEGRTLGRSGRFAQLRSVIQRTFDPLTMARLSAGPSWATLTDAQRQQMAETVGCYIAAQCSDRFDSCSGQNWR